MAFGKEWIEDSPVSNNAGRESNDDWLGDEYHIRESEDPTKKS